MKLSDMSFEDSHNAELLLIPKIEELIKKDEELAGCFDTLSLPPIGDDRKRIVKERMTATNKAMRKLANDYYEETCYVLSILNQKDIKEIKKQKRSEANAQIVALLSDTDFLGFFASSESMEQVAQSVISLTPEELSRLEQPSTT